MVWLQLCAILSLLNDVSSARENSGHLDNCGSRDAKQLRYLPAISSTDLLTIQLLILTENPPCDQGNHTGIRRLRVTMNALLYDQ